MKQKSAHRCPYCFAALPSGMVFRTCPQGLLEPGSACSGHSQVPVRLGTPQEAQYAQCPDHVGTKLADSCYAEGCRKFLPPRWAEVTTSAIAMAGTRASGKTVYLGKTARLLFRWAPRHGVTVAHYDVESRKIFEKFYGPLDSGESLYGSTVPEMPGQEAQQRDPVLLRFQRPNAPDHVLILRDVAGEDLQNAAMSTDYFRFLANADGLILMVDPAESPEIRTELSGVVDLPVAECNADAVWGNLQALQLAVNGSDADAVPVAVTLSKFDVVKLAAERPNSRFADLLSARGSRLRQDPSLREAAFSTADADLLDLELQTLHRSLGNAALVDRRLHKAGNAGRGRAEARMFAVSSLGQAPTVGRVSGHGAIQFRCLDPLKWFLSEAGVFASS